MDPKLDAATAVEGVPTDEELVRIGDGCALDCRFCPHGRGRAGAPLADVLAPDFRVPVARRVTIQAGDVLRADLAPLVRRLRAAGATSVLAYAHPGVRDADAALDALAAAGLTGIHLMLPAASREAMSRLTGGRGSLARAASLIEAANARHLDVAVEIPVVASSVDELAGTVRRALNRIARPERIVLRFLSEFDPATGPRPWDVSRAAGPIDEAVAIARARAVPLMLGHPEAPPPCVLDVPHALPDLYPSLSVARAGQDRERPLPACASCAVATVCASDGRFVSALADKVRPIRRPDEVPQPPSPAPADAPGLPALPTSAELFLRQATLAELIDEVRRRPRICRFPWEALEAHDIRGVVTPCAGGWPLPEATDGCVSWHGSGLLDAWNSAGMRAFRRAIARGRPLDTCKADCPAFHGGPQSAVPSFRAPATRVFHDNVVRNVREMLDGAEVLSSRPQTISFSPTLQCPNHCRMCDIHKVREFMGNGPEMRDMPDRLFDELLELLPTTRVLALTGGEPLMSRKMRELLRRFTADAHPDGAVTITTNGLLLGPPVLRDLARTPIRLFYVSLNAADDATYERVSGGTRHGFTRVLANVRRLLDAAPSMAGRPRVVLSFVVQRSNRAQLPAFLDVALRLGTGVRLLPIERDRMGESIFTEESLVRDVLDVVRAQVAPRLPDMPWQYRHEVGKLLSVLNGRLERRVWDPL